MKNLLEMEQERMEWSLKTFPEATAISSLRKLESEIAEIETNLNNGIRDPEEYADALMCLFDSAGRAGISPEEIIHCFEIKLEKNKKRIWKKNADNSYSHVKTEVKTTAIIGSDFKSAIDQHLARFPPGTTILIVDEPGVGHRSNELRTSLFPKSLDECKTKEVTSLEILQDINRSMPIITAPIFPENRRTRRQKRKPYIKD